MFSKLDVADVEAEVILDSVADVVAEAEVRVVGGELADVAAKVNVVAVGVSDVKGEVMN